jgi:hypothetical protein
MARLPDAFIDDLLALERHPPADHLDDVGARQQVVPSSSTTASAAARTAPRSAS